MSNTLKELQGMSDEQLILEHDDEAKYTSSVGINYYLDELNRRAQKRQTETMLAYTRRMLWMTVFIAILTAINVIAVFVPLFCR